MHTTRLIAFLRAAAAIGLAALISGCAGSGSSSKQKYEFEVTFPSGGLSVPVPVVVEPPSEFTAGGREWEVRISGGDPSAATPVQLTADGKLVFLWSHTGNPGSRKFTLQPRQGAPSPFEIEESSPDELLITENGNPAICYVFGMILAEGVPEDRRRSSYFHPVWGVDGTVLSDDFPEDHYHHRGFFWTWPQVFYQGDTLSLWDIRGVHQRFEDWLERKTGPVFARLSVQNGWYLDDGSRIMDERVTATIYRASQLGRIIDFELHWEPTGERVGIQGSADIKGYGGFSLRFAPFEEPVITTVDGVNPEDTNRVPSPWADLSARFAGKSTYEGVAIFDHKNNLSFPNGWCLRHYGFEGIAWPGIEPYWLEHGHPLTARYRVWIHDGDAVAGKVADVYNSWAKMPSGGRAN